MSDNPSPVPDEIKRQRQRNRNIAVFAVLLAMAGLLYGVTIVRIKLGMSK